LETPTRQNPFEHVPATDPEDLVAFLLAWYEQKGRDLPWRCTRDPYRIWLSEIMLQQTGVETVIPYFRRFLGRFPAVENLAAAPIDSVIELWAGLGYYSRARNLHRAARKVVEEFSGRFPDDLHALMNLPGVGRSTAGAILSIAFDIKAPILDGNVRRVLCRLFCMEENPRTSRGEGRLWALADALTPDRHPHDYAQAIMDLGATVCTPRRPDCKGCPLEIFCLARKCGRQEELPVRVQRKPVPSVTAIAMLLGRGDKFLVHRRPLEGMLGGLWEFPGAPVPEREDPAETARRLLRFRGEPGDPVAAGRIRHAYSHFRLDLHLYYCEATGDSGLAETGENRWVDTDTLANLHLHGAHKKALALLHSPGNITSDLLLKSRSTSPAGPFRKKKGL
jgi:A/G-specific adenine glycosylase